MEFVTVTFSDERTVFIDGDEGGLTNRTLRVNEGTHTFNLGDPRNYQPKWRRPRVTGTTEINPMEVVFEKI